MPPSRELELRNPLIILVCSKVNMFLLGKYHLLPQGGLLEFGGTQNFGLQKGGVTKEIFPLKRENRRFS